MSDDEMTPTDAASELSDEELDKVAGGFSLRMNFAVFQYNKVLATQETNSGSGLSSSKSVFAAESTEGAALQISITDATAADLKALSGLLGNVTEIEGSS